MRIFLLLTILAFIVTQQVSGGAVSSNQLQVISPSSQFDVLPKFISGSPPTYPLSQLQRGQSGYAIVEFTIDETGKTRDWRVIETSYSYYGSHAILALQQWRFQPALKHGRPVSCRARMRFVYMFRGR